MTRGRGATRCGDECWEFCCVADDDWVLCDELGLSIWTVFRGTRECGAISFNNSLNTFLSVSLNFTCVTRFSINPLWSSG